MLLCTRGAPSQGHYQPSDSLHSTGRAEVEVDSGRDTGEPASRVRARSNSAFTGWRSYASNYQKPSALHEASAIELTNTKDHPPGCMVVASAINGSPQSAHLQAALRGCRLEAEARITARIKRGVRDGELPPRTNAAALGKFCMTVMQGMTIQARDGATQKELVAVAKAAMLQWPEFS
jgi:hypothetical protein